jgi:hypothetical protein
MQLNMAFQEIERPNPDQYIHPVPSEYLMKKGMALVEMPALSTILTERRHWLRTRKMEDSPWQEVAKELDTDLRELNLGSIAILTAQQKGKVFEDADGEMVLWHYSRLATILPLSGLLRSLEASDQGSEESEESQQTYIDINLDELDKSGMHVNDITLEDFGMHRQDVGSEVWYESDAIYVRARKPAEPTTTLLAKIKAQGQSRLERADHTSLVPRMKVEAWRGQ